VPNLDLVGQIPVQIDYAYSITATRMSIRESTPTKVPKGAFGAIGTAQGIPDVTAQITFAVPDTGLEFNWTALATRATGFTMTFTAGATTYLLVGCKRSERSFSNDPGAGDATFDVSLTATEMIEA
jgi:hypothetical protein